MDDAQPLHELNEDYDDLIDETSREQTEKDEGAFALQAMLKFHAERIEELKTLAAQFAASDMTHRLGLFLEADVKAHEQIHEWAARMFDQPPPDWKAEPYNYNTWLTCLRLFRRHVGAWRWHQDFWVRGDELLRQMADQVPDQKLDEMFGAEQ